MRWRSSRRFLFLFLFFVLSLPLLFQSCSMARYPITATGLRYATSLSPVLQDSRGKNLYFQEDLAPLGDFEFSRRGGMGDTPLDLSEDLNREVERRKGEGIVNLSFRVKNTFGGQDVTVTGTVVSRKASRTGAGEEGR